jgi:hypothetical protein
MFTGTVRHRRVVLAAGVFVAGAAWLGLAASAGLGRDLLRLCLIPLALVSPVLALVAMWRPGPAAFVVDPRTRSFRAPPHPAHVYLALMLVSVSVVGFPPQVPPALDDAPAFVNLIAHLVTGSVFVLAGLVVVLSAVTVVAVWRGVGVQLRPDGLVDRTPLGTLVVPGEALAPGYPLPVPPAASHLTLTYARPELVRRRGLVVFRRLVQTSNVDTMFLVHAIRYYLDHPQHRPLIGTQAEYDDLLPAVSGPTSSYRQS